MMRLHLKLAALLAATLLALTLSSLAPAQSSGALQAITPMTRDPGALSTFTATGASTVNSSDQSGFNASRVICLLRVASGAGLPSVTFSIQNKDAASGQYYTLVTSTAITSSAAANYVMMAGTSLPSSPNFSANAPIARTWRISTVIAGSATPSITGTVGCSVQ